MSKKKYIDSITSILKECDRDTVIAMYRAINKLNHRPNRLLSNLISKGGLIYGKRSLI